MIQPFHSNKPEEKMKSYRFGHRKEDQIIELCLVSQPDRGPDRVNLSSRITVESLNTFWVSWDWEWLKEKTIKFFLCFKQSFFSEKKVHKICVIRNGAPILWGKHVNLTPYPKCLTYKLLATVVNLRINFYFKKKFKNFIATN
jgi:hypothetical protein